VLTNPIDFDQADYMLNDVVKPQFFNDVGYTLPTTDFVPSQGNLKLAPVSLISAMKIKTMFQRTAFRDYYDIYVIVKEGHLTLPKLIDLACIYNDKLRPSTIINRLTAHEKFKEEKNFGLLKPRYIVSCKEIGSFFSGAQETL
jgi:predicted nucleotidyltransferase component of viral defense system